MSSSSSSSSSLYVCHRVRPLVDPLLSHISRSLFGGLPRFLLQVGKRISLTIFGICALTEGREKLNEEFYETQKCIVGKT